MLCEMCVGLLSSPEPVHDLALLWRPLPVASDDVGSVVGPVKGVCAISWRVAHLDVRRGQHLQARAQDLQQHSVACMSGPCRVALRVP